MFLANVAWRGCLVAGVLTTFEGQLENQDQLIVLLADYGRFDWTQNVAGFNLRNSKFISTFHPDEDGSMAPFNFTPQVMFAACDVWCDFALMFELLLWAQWDWQTRHWQYLKKEHDRYNVTGPLPEWANVTLYDVINFRDRQVSSECPMLHYKAESKHDECIALKDAQRYVKSVPQYDHLLQLHSYAEGMSTALYEKCLVRWRNV